VAPAKDDDDLPIDEEDLAPLLGARAAGGGVVRPSSGGDSSKNG
jgi:hypothetical protein